MACVAGLWLALLAGCKALDGTGLFALQTDASGRDQVVAGSLEVVSHSAQTALSQLGMVAVVNQSGETIRIHSKTPRGAAFTLVLNRDKSNGTEQTRVHVEWESASDDQIGLDLLARIVSQNAM
jgi:hypothetical protein